MSKLVVNRITNCEDVSINMDNTTIVGNFESLQVNDVRDSKRTRITMKDVKVLPEDEYIRRKFGRERPSYEPPSNNGKLSVNKVVDSQDTTIDQQNIQIRGSYEDLRVNEVSSSSRTNIRVGRIRINDSDSEDSEDPDTSDELDEDGLPKPTTYAYYIAEKFNFTVNLGSGSTVSCSFLKKARVRTVKKFISEMKDDLKDKNFRLQECESQRFVDDDEEATLQDAGFKKHLALKVALQRRHDRYQ